MLVLCLTCKDRPGIVAAVSGFLADQGLNIEDSSQFHEPRSNRFYMRVKISGNATPDDFRKAFSNVAERFEMTWQVYEAAQKVRTVLLVSKTDHCLHHLLYQTKDGSLPIEITAIASNHETARPLAELYGLPFHYLPIGDDKTAQEQKLISLIDDTDSELIVMARYMQILSDGFIVRYTGRIINIHHSFLPGFKGARPYHQAYERGVKLIGATAHFATADLDEGPIIEQSVVPVSHRNSPEDMQRMGRDTESLTLARAIQHYAERRVFIHGNRTIIL